jgi:hypothetical protein
MDFWLTVLAMPSDILKPPWLRRGTATTAPEYGDKDPERGIRSLPESDAAGDEPHSDYDVIRRR